ncbi:MAG TPA: hypothetical protein VFC51_02135 [Chloroflexota bacterium]|nr:hypothetical protein [Chloroflexota bacterium]
MNPSHLKPGAQYTLSDGSIAEVQRVLPGSINVQVRYIDSLDNPEIPVGAEREVPFEEIIAEYLGTHAEGLT